MGQRAVKNHRVLIERTVLALMGGACYLYSIFGSDFAELHVRIPRLDFPVFAGEILLLGCLLLLGPVYCRSRPVWGQRGGMIVGFYAAWLLIKAFLGYWAGGPLAFRNAALFYYPFFAIIGFLVYDPKFFSGRILSCLIFFLAVNFMVMPVGGYYLFAYGMMILVLALKMKNPWLRILAFGVVAFQFIAARVVAGSRSHMIGTGLAAVFLVGYFFLGLLTLRWRAKLAAVVVSVGILIFCVFKFADPHAVQSLLDVGRIPEKFRKLDREIAAKRPGFVREQLSSGVYHENPENVMCGIIQTSLNRAEEITALPFAGITGREAGKAAEEQGEATPPPIVGTVSPDPPSAPAKTVEAATESPNVRAPRDLDIANNNILFRLFIWRDMLEDLKRERAWWSGVGFEYPQRSSSIEILDWAPGEWRRDGWITPHNSFLHMIYRGGIVGAGVVAALFAALVCFTRRFLYLKSVEGGLLMAILLYWLGLANFLVFLELPYGAIPFWSLFGMTAAYLKHLENHHRAGLQAQNP